MTIKEALARVLEIQKVYAQVHDKSPQGGSLFVWANATAHEMEDDLREDILVAIAAGSPDAVSLAKIALTTNLIGFSRWTS